MRKLLILACAALLVALMALPASAAILTFEDYITDYGVDANNQDFVECTMPAAGFLLHVMNGGTIIHETTGSGTTYLFSSGQDPGFRVYPFGPKNRMELRDIPNGTQLDFTVTVSNSANAVNGQLSCYIQYFDGDLALLSTTTLQTYTGGIPYTWDISHKMNYPEGAEYFQIYLYMNGWTVLSSAASFGISCSDFVFTLDIKYLPDDSAVLDNISGTLDEINGAINNGPNSPDGSDIFEDFEQTEDQIMDSVSGGLADIPDLFTDIATNWREYSSAFLAYIRIFEAFAGVSIIPLLLRFSLAFGVVGILVNLGVEGAINADRRSFNQKKALWKRAYDAESRAAPTRIKARGYSQS